MIRYSLLSLYKGISNKIRQCMKHIKLRMEMSTEDTLRFLVRLISITLPKPLTPKEEETLTEFLLLPYERFRYHRFSQFARRRVFKALKAKSMIAGRQVLNFRINSLERKGILFRDEEGQLHIVPQLESMFRAYFKTHKEKPGSKSEDLYLTFIFPPSTIPKGIGEDGKITPDERYLEMQEKIEEDRKKGEGKQKEEEKSSNKKQKVEKE